MQVKKQSQINFKSLVWQFFKNKKNIVIWEVNFTSYLL